MSFEILCSLDAIFSDSVENLASQMYLLSSDSPYAQNCLQLESFLRESLQIQNQQALPSCYVFVVFAFSENNCLEGFLMCRCLFDEIEIEFIAVRPRSRRLGIAACLLSFVFGRFPEATFFLEVAQGNLPALLFYQKYQFSEISKRVKYYKNGEDALVLRRLPS